ncbi:MAG TPA: protoporphyrinogen oxidase [Bryobacteraceae bacterium]|nr:protoporphyrinogen oxidase [Bryobacteraceae bacterium]
MTQTPVVIIGGGITGLSAAYDLARANVPHLLIEQQPRLGGVIETNCWEGCILERGPDSFLTAKSDGLTLINELGLGDQVMGSNDEGRTTYILRKGRLVLLPEGVTMFIPSRAMPVLRTRLFSWGTKFRMGLELLRKPSQLPDRSVAEFVVDHFGQETLEYLAEPLLSGVYGGDPAQLSIASVLPRFVEMERREGSLARAVIKGRKEAPPVRAGTSAPFQTTLKGGLGTLVEKLIPFATVRRGAAETIERTESGWRVRVSGDWIDASQVVVACPAWAASALLQSADSRLSELLGAVPYSSSVTVTLIYRDGEFDGTRAGFGFLVPQVERRRMLGCTFVGTKFANRVPPGKLTLRCFFGGIGDGAVLSESDESLVTMAREELRRILKLTSAPIHASIARWPRSMAQYTVGHGARLKEIEARAAALPGLHLAGNAYTGIGIPDCIRMGRAAAKKILGAQG